MTATLVLATVPHLKEIAGLLRQAAEGSNSPFHERRLRRLVTCFEGLVQPFESIASSLDVGCVTELSAAPFPSASKEEGPEDADQTCNESDGVEEAARAVTS
jgi:hypothetical protein